MSSHVVVLDSTARRATIKTTPGKYLTDILQEACKKLGLDASQYGLKYKSRQLDLSLVFRLSGLVPGAKLELVQLSRSPSVVNVALQLPPSEAQGTTNGRLMDKFPSTTSIWMVMRKFEAGVAGSTSTRNLTGRGVPEKVESGSGRLFYETPVIQFLNRELSTLPDFQKSLARLGFNSGNVLLRLSFRQTDEPLEAAMVKIQEYFQSVDDGAKTTEASPPQKVDNTTQLAAEPQNPTTDVPVASKPPQQALHPTTFPVPGSDPVPEAPEEPSTAFSRPVTVFAPPTNNTPQSAQTPYHDTDYIPSVEHAQAHQRRLLRASKPTRLPTDAEIAASAAAEEERRSSIKEIEIKVRFPDQSQVITKFGQQDTGKVLYDFVRSCLAAQFAGEKFTLSKFSGATPASASQLPGATTKAQKTSTATPKSVIPDSEQSFLIKHNGMTGRVLVNFSWHEDALSARQNQSATLLKPELRTQAQQMKVEQPSDVMDTSGDSPGGGVGESNRQDRDKPSGRKGSGMPKWLKLPGKK